MSTAIVIGTRFPAPPTPSTDADDEQLAALKPKKIWEQEVRDEEGRRRFHGAFTGGFSAGYYNTVGTKEGWAPATFTSSRKARAAPVQQKPEDFMDDDDDATLGRQLKTRGQFDTFGTATREAAVIASTDALSSLFDMGGNLSMTPRMLKTMCVAAPVIPGPVIDELIIPSTQPIGKQLLSRMGWREGQGLGPRAARKKKHHRPAETTQTFTKAASGGVTPHAADAADDDGDDPFEARHVFAPRNSSVFTVKPKNDNHGLGFDPLSNAPEFAKLRDARPSSSIVPESRIMTVGRALASGDVGGGFSVGVFDDEDTEHLGHDADVYGTDSRSNYLRTLGDPEDDIPTPRTQKKTDVAASRSGSSVGGGLFGFVAATGDSGRVQERVFVLPPPPREYRCMHVFTEKEDAEFAAMRALVGGGPVSRPQQPMSTLTRAALLGEKLTLPVPPQAPPVPSPVAAPTLPAILSESRFVASSVPGTMYTARDVGGGGLMSKKEFEEKFSKASNPGAPTAAAVIPEAPVHRVVSDWIPDRLLCKRFNVPDPYSGRVVPADSSDAAKRSSKFSDPGIDMFALPDFAGQRTAASVTKPPEQALSGEKDVAAATSDTAEAAAPARPPVDLFKSIFEPSDSEDD